MEDYTDFVHVGPGTLAGRYLRQFWHPVYVDRELPVKRALPLRLLGENFTLYKGESGRSYVIAERCAHRNTALAVGRVEGDQLRCFYHGWKYDGTGACVERPPERDTTGHGICIKAYPTREYLGLIFAYFGEGEPPAMQRYPEMEDDANGILWANMDRVAIPHNYFQRVENGVDETHVVFAHGEVFEKDGVAQVPEMHFEETEYGVRQEGRRANGTVRVGHFHMPNINFVTIPPSPGEVGWGLYLGHRTPIDDSSYRNFDVRRLKISDETRQRLENDPAFRARWEPLPRSLDKVVEYAQAILAGTLTFAELDQSDKRLLINVQDHVAILGQGPITDRANERLGRSDSGVALLRRIWARELQALAEGRPTKKWQHPGTGLMPKTGAARAAE